MSWGLFEIVIYALVGVCIALSIIGMSIGRAKPPRAEIDQTVDEFLDKFNQSATSLDELIKKRCVDLELSMERIELDLKISARGGLDVCEAEYAALASDCMEFKTHILNQLVIYRSYYPDRYEDPTSRKYIMVSTGAIRYPLADSLGVKYVITADGIEYEKPEDAALMELAE